MKVRSGLIQMALKGDTKMSPEEITKEMIEAHIPFIEEAGKKGVQVLCMQEVLHSRISVRVRTQNGMLRLKKYLRDQLPN